MKNPKIDFLKKKYDLQAPKKSPFLFFGKTIIAVIVVLATVGSIFSYRVSSTSDSGGSFPHVSLLSTIKHLVSSDRELAGENSDRVNFLLMGIGGEGHDGPQLTDTIIFASLKPSTDEVGLMSLPRDMTVPIPGYGYRKVNHANAYGEMNDPGSGPLLASQVIGEILQEDIQYYLRVDFDGFAEFIDNIGGIDVYVDRSFTDPSYPTLGREYDTCGYGEPEELENSNKMTVVFEGDDINTEEPVPGPDYSCRFEKLTFKEGWTRMNGKTALGFVRSRHGTNGEGSDFARSARQQKVLLAVKDKIFSASTFLNPSKINKILKTLEKNISTNISVWEFVRLAKQLKKLDQTQITHHVIDASDSSPLYATVLNGSYVLLPKNDDWTELQLIAEQVFIPRDEQNRFASTTEEKPLFVKVEIQNGTNMTGLAFRASQLLDGQGFEVVSVGNAATRGYEHTVIYDLTNGQRADELKALRDFLKADVTLSATGWMISGDVVPKGISVTSDEYENLTTNKNVDFLVILGENSSSVVRNQ